MGALTTTKGLVSFLALVALPALGHSQSVAPRTLFSQSAIEILERDFPKHDASFLVLDARSGALLAENWDNFDKPIPLGSLVKPFTALAYASAHEFRYPRYECKGQASQCWQIRPHGELDLVSAISLSCNAYFRRMAEAVSSEQLELITKEFRLESPDRNFQHQALAGLGDQWRIAPVHMAQAYIELYRQKQRPGVPEIFRGMRQSALRGTGAALGRRLKHTSALVKTGTAPCTHAPSAPADGFA